MPIALGRESNGEVETVRWRRVITVAVAGAVAGALAGPAVADESARLGALESTIRCIQPPCPGEASADDARLVSVALALVIGLAGFLVALVVDLRGRRPEPSLDRAYERKVVERTRRWPDGAPWPEWTPARRVAAAVMVVPPWALTAFVVARAFAIGFCDLGDSECTPAEDEQLRRLTTYAIIAFVATIPGPILLFWLRRTMVWLAVLVFANGLIVLEILT
ncbi:MAG TPA: hypothetical protein VF045_00565 [Acidimicrobiales bacterium]